MDGSQGFLEGHVHLGTDPGVLSEGEGHDVSTKSGEDPGFLRGAYQVGGIQDFLEQNLKKIRCGSSVSQRGVMGIM